MQITGGSIEDALWQAGAATLDTGVSRINLPGRREVACLVTDVDLMLVLISEGADVQPPLPRLDYPGGRAVYVIAPDADGGSVRTLAKVLTYLRGE
jgi:hypothetical protein